jgi:hypothetical protein
MLFDTWIITSSKYQQAPDDKKEKKIKNGTEWTNWSPSRSLYINKHQTRYLKATKIPSHVIGFLNL